MKVNKLRHLAALNGCKIERVPMTKAHLLQYIEHKLDHGGRLLVPDSSSRSLWLAGATRKRRKAQGESISQIRAALRLLDFTHKIVDERTKDLDRAFKDVVKRMDAEGKSITHIRAALRLLGFTQALIDDITQDLDRARSSRYCPARRKHMDRASGESVAINASVPDTASANSSSEATQGSAASQGFVADERDVNSEPQRPRPTLAELRKMNINELRRFAASRKVYVSSRRFGVSINRPTEDVMQDVVRKLRLGDRSTNAMSTQCNAASRVFSGDVSVPTLAQCRAKDMSFVRKRPASALASTCDSGAFQCMLSGEAVSTLTKFREMNINKLRHVAGFNGVRICLGKSDGCKPRKRTKTEMLQDIEYKLKEGCALLVPVSSSQFTTISQRKRPMAKDVVQQMEAAGQNRTQIRAALKKHGFAGFTIWIRTKHLDPERVERETTISSTEANATASLSAAACASNNALDLRNDG